MEGGRGRTEGGEEDEAAGREDGAGLVPYYPKSPPYDCVSEDDLWDGFRTHIFADILCMRVLNAR